MEHGLNTYKKISVNTASKEQILLMLYETAIKNCKLAIQAIDNKQIAKKGEHIGKFQDIIVELNNGLDFNVDKKMATDLSNLYDYLLFTSTQANINFDKKSLEDCLQILSTLHSAWIEAIKSLKKNNKEGK
ncbi:MAG: flagellar export chaperone FliS [Oligoflexia bacterium]|nr:flagellar export chaperone FliS [Oligoflexia bacterium]